MTAATLLLFVIPGVALGPILVPGAATPVERLGRAAGISLMSGMVVCVALASLGWLTGPAVAVSLMAVSAAGFAVNRPRLRWPGPRSRRWWVGAGAGVAVAVVLVVVPSRLSVGPELLPLTSTTWYYANLAQMMAAAGRIPAGISEWGAIHAFQTDYLPVTAHTAGAMLILPGDILADLEIYRLAILVIGVILAVVLLRRWVSSWAALLGAILLFSTIHLDQKYDGYRPETVAFDLALLTLWLADRVIVERSRRIAALAVVSGALVFTAHAEVFLILLCALAGLGVGRAIVAPDDAGARRFGLRLRFGSPGLRALGVAASIGLAGVAAGSLAMLAATGDAGVVDYLRGPRDSASQVIAPPDQADIPAGWSFSGDPTWDFYVAAVVPELVGTAPPSSFRDTQFLPRTILRVWTGLDGRSPIGLLALLAISAAPLIAWRRLDARRRRAVVTWLVFGTLLFVGSYVLFAISHTYVPGRTGGRRLLPYLVVVPVLGATFLLWGAGRVIVDGGVDRLLGRRRRRWASARPRAALAVLSVIAIWTVGTAIPLEGRQASLSEMGYQAFTWMHDNLPTDARILANAYTDGSIAAVTGRVGITDGRAVYLEDPAFLAESTALCLAARVVFATPAAPGAQEFLVREHVDYLIVSTAGPFGGDLGGYPLFATDLAALAASPTLHLARSFGDGRLLLYAVTRA